MKKMSRVDNLFPDSRPLPLEIVSYVDVEDAQEKEKHIEVSLLHLQRSLTLHRLLERTGDKDFEQVWIDAVILLDDVSFYAVMTMPMLRQHLEDDCEIDYDLCNTTNGIDEFEVNNYWDRCLKSHGSAKKALLLSLLTMSKKSSSITEELELASDKKSFTKVFIRAYEYCSELALLSSQIKKSKISSSE